MTTRLRPVPATYLALLVALVLIACTPQPPTATPDATTIRITVADIGAPLVERLAATYSRERSWVTVYVEVFNDNISEARLRAGGIDLAVLSWVSHDEPPLWSTPLAEDALAVIAHPATPLTSLGLSQVQDIFSGRTGDLPDGTPIQVVSREQGAGARTLFETQVMEPYAVTSAAVVMSDSRSTIDYIARTPGALGYAPLRQCTGRNVRLLALDGCRPVDNTCAYPLTYSLYLVARSEPTGPAREFAQWLLRATAE